MLDSIMSDPDLMKRLKERFREEDGEEEEKRYDTGLENFNTGRVDYASNRHYFPNS